MKKFILSKIEMPQGQVNSELIQRLYEFGLHPGLEITVVAQVSFNSVTVIQFGMTRLALNAEEFACLHGH